MFWILFSIVVYVVSVLFNIFVMGPLWYRYSPDHEEMDLRFSLFGPLSIPYMILMFVYSFFTDEHFQNWYTNYLFKFGKKEKENV